MYILQTFNPSSIFQIVGNALQIKQKVSEATNLGFIF